MSHLCTSFLVFIKKPIDFKSHSDYVFKYFLSFYAPIMPLKYKVMYIK